MSTRCQIGVYEKDGDIENKNGILKKFVSLLYRHSDGYPGSMDKEDDIGVVPDILPFIKEFVKVRGFDSEYMGACLVAYLKHWHCGQIAIDKSGKYYRAEAHVIVNGFEVNPLCHGICRNFHCDIAYFYAITPTKLTVFNVKVDSEYNYEFEKLKEYKIR